MKNTGRNNNRYRLTVFDSVQVPDNEHAGETTMAIIHKHKHHRKNSHS